jgi:pyridoxamine 5'-phosphate oxidase
MTPAESDRYFASRPRESQIGAWASSQSEKVESRAALQTLWDEQNKAHKEDVPRPPHWGGFLLHIEQIEFWQGRPGRMHDRISAQLLDQGWQISRLQP